MVNWPKPLVDQSAADVAESWLAPLKQSVDDSFAAWNQTAQQAGSALQSSIADVTRQVTNAASLSLPSLDDLQQQAQPQQVPQPQQAGGSVLPSLDWLTSLLPSSTSTTQPTSTSTTASAGTTASSFGAGTSTPSASGTPSAMPTGAGQQPAPTTLPDRMDTSSREANLRQWAPILRDVEQRTGFRADALAAIIQAENGGGQSPLSANDNNYFSISTVDSPYQAGPGTGGRFGRYTNPVDSLNHFIDLISTSPRYREAYENRGDPAKFFQGLVNGGYIVPEPGFPVETWLGNLDAGRQTFNQIAPPAAPTAAPQQTAQQPQQQSAYTPETLVPNQFSEGRQQGLSPEEAAAICGPAAAVAFARANGRTPTLREATELARSAKLWSAQTGMYGPQAEATLLERLGVPSRVVQGVDWNAVRAAVSSGMPVILSSPGHYFVATAAYPDGTFEFGNSAGVLRAAGGRTRFRPEEIPSLGMGAPNATILMGAASA